MTKKKTLNLLILFLFVCISKTISQKNWKESIDDPYFNTVLRNGLQIGDEMPDIPLGDVINNTLNARTFSDLRGKLVILDFWASFCASCIEGFPKMEKIQQELGDKVQIILVNPFESKENVTARLPKFKFPNLPSIMKDTLGKVEELLRLFPLRSLGHQVWIDKDGIIKLRGGHQNTYITKILDFLSGKDIYILNDNATVPNFDPSYPYSKLIGNFKSTPIKIGSIITPFNNEYEAENSRTGLLIIDSVAKTIRNTYINVNICNFYIKAYKKELTKNKEKLLFGPISKSSFGGSVGYHFIILPKDTLRYTNDFLNGAENDLLYVKPKICYEQILPSNVPPDTQIIYMLQDINKYLANLYGTQVSLEKKKVNCHILIRTSSLDKLKSKKNSYTQNDISRKKNNLYNDVSLGYLGKLIERNDRLSNYFYDQYKLGNPTFFINGTDFSNSKKIDLGFFDENKISSMEDLNIQLKKYDLAIKYEERVFNFLVIKDK